METATIVSLLGSLVTIAIAGIGAAYTYGSLASKLESLGQTVGEGFKELKDSRDKAGARLGDVERGIVRLESEVFRETTQRYDLSRTERRRERRESGSHGDE